MTERVTRSVAGRQLTRARDFRLPSSASFTSLGSVECVAGAIYLVYLGIQSIRGRGGLRAGEKTPAQAQAGRAYLQGLLTNLGNPKMITFTVAFLPQFVDPRLGHVWAQFLVLGTIFLVFEFAVDGTVGIFAGRMGRLLERRKARRGAEIATGSIFIGLAARLAFEKR